MSPTVQVVSTPRISAQFIYRLMSEVLVHQGHVDGDEWEPAIYDPERFQETAERVRELLSQMGVAVSTEPIPVLPHMTDGCVTGKYVSIDPWPFQV
jgi:hypothetical protein